MSFIFLESYSRNGLVTDVTVGIGSRKRKLLQDLFIDNSIGLNSRYLYVREGKSVYFTKSVKG